MTIKLDSFKDHCEYKYKWDLLNGRAKNQFRTS